MLTVGNLMNEGTYRGQASGFTLDSLLKMVHTKGEWLLVVVLCLNKLSIVIPGVDKKTSVLDYVIKSLIEKGEDRLLSISETLDIDEETTRLSGGDASREVEMLSKDFSKLDCEYNNARNGKVVSEAVSAFNGEFTDRMEDFLQYARSTMSKVHKVHDLMKRKIVTVMEYFGEDAGDCETTKIFSVIRQFLVAFESSKKAMIERKNRKEKRNK